MAPKRATTLVLLVTISTQVSPCCDLLASGILSFVRKKPKFVGKQKGSGQLMTVTVTQVLGEPGVWSALSFLGGGNAAGKRSTDETQVSYIIRE